MDHLGVFERLMQLHFGDDVGQHQFVLPEKGLGNVGWSSDSAVIARGYSTVAQTEDHGVSGGFGSLPTLKMLTKWLQSTRLETRTKESDMYASVWVFQTRTRNESKRRWDRSAVRACTIDRSG